MVGRWAQAQACTTQVQMLQRHERCSRCWRIVLSLRDRKNEFQDDGGVKGMFERVHGSSFRIWSLRISEPMFDGRASHDSRIKAVQCQCWQENGRKRFFAELSNKRNNRYARFHTSEGRFRTDETKNRQNKTLVHGKANQCQQHAPSLGTLQTFRVLCRAQFKTRATDGSDNRGRKGDPSWVFNTKQCSLTAVSILDRCTGPCA